MAGNRPLYGIGSRRGGPVEDEGIIHGRIDLRGYV